MRDLNNPLSQSKFDPPKKERNKRSTPKSTGYLHGQYLTKTGENTYCLLYTSPSPRDRTRSRMPSSA